MSARRLVGALLAAALLPVSNVSAKELRLDDGPAEVPPPSYEGRQYVDSKGCIYVRAGFDGAVTWVPRVTRGRKVVCGARPTLAGAAMASAPAHAAPPPEAPGRKVAYRRAAPPAPAPKVAYRPAPKVVYQPAREVAHAPAPYQAPAPAVSYTRRLDPHLVRVVPARDARATLNLGRPKTNGAVGSYNARLAAVPVTACPGASPVSARYMAANRPGMTVRCGPQAYHPSGGYGGGSMPGYYGKAYEAPVHVPHGYKPAFDDGRLNPYRGVGTLAGHLQMRRTWTDEVPRRLIDPYGRRVVTRGGGGLVEEVGRIFGTTKGAAPGATAPAVQAQPVVVSSKTAPRAATKAPKAVAARYVQVATYGDSAAARKVAARLAGKGLPMRTGTVTRQGRKLAMVLAGPFTDAGEAARALRAVQGAGFGSARLR